MFRPPVDFCPHALFLHLLTQIGHKVIDILFTIDAPLMQQLRDAFIFIRMQIAEAVIFELPFQLADTEPVSQRRIDVRALFCRQHAFIFWRIFHLTQMRNPLGQLDDHAAEIFHHREQHTADIVHLG